MTATAITKTIHNCAAGHGSGADADGLPCPGCNGYGWAWSDGAPPTICPGGGRRPPVANPERLPCGRMGHRCPGCDRDSAAIPTDADRARVVPNRKPATDAQGIAVVAPDASKGLGTMALVWPVGDDAVVISTTAFGGRSGAAAGRDPFAAAGVEPEGDELADDDDGAA